MGGDRMTGGPKPTVLIVDDSEAVCLTLSMMLEKHGFQAQTAHNSAEALRFAAETHFNVVLVDFNLGLESGSDVARELFHLDPAYPIVFMSGAVNLREELERHPELRSARVLQKPFSRHELLDCLHSIIGKAA